jgi:hypothetical protein
MTFNEACVTAITEDVAASIDAKGQAVRKLITHGEVNWRCVAVWPKDWLLDRRVGSKERADNLTDCINVSCETKEPVRYTGEFYRRTLTAACPIYGLLPWDDNASHHFSAWINVHRHTSGETRQVTEVNRWALAVRPICGIYVLLADNVA